MCLHWCVNKNSRISLSCRPWETHVCVTPQAVVSPSWMQHYEGRDTFVVQRLSWRNDCSQGNVLEWSPLSNRGSFHKD